MSYYQGDFYQGDPFFGGLFTRLGRGIVSGVKGAIGFGGRSQAIVRGVLPGGTGMTGAIQTVARRAGAIVAKHPVLSAAGAAGTIGLLGGMGGEKAISMMGAPGVGAKGFHMSKPRRGVASHLVRNRHMRVTNPRALKRALRRAHGFARLAMKTIHLIHPKKKARFGGWKKRRAR